MIKLGFTEPGGEARAIELDKHEVIIGRAAGSDLVLDAPGVAQRHARILIKDGRALLMDLRTPDGTLLNGARISGPQVLGLADTIGIGEATVRVEALDTSGPGSSSEIGVVTRASRSGGPEPPSLASGSLRPLRVATQDLVPPPPDTGTVDLSAEMEAYRGDDDPHRRAPPALSPRLMRLVTRLAQSVEARLDDAESSLTRAIAAGLRTTR